MDSSDNQIAAPEFLTSLYFQGILQKFNGDETLKVNSIKLTLCTEGCASALSLVYRVEVFASQNDGLKHGNFVVEITREKLCNDHNIFKKELKLFQKVLPKLRNILKSVGDSENVFPKAIAVDRNEGVLVLEDLVQRKFAWLDLSIRLDSNHIKLSLKNLAKFHAASMVLMEKDPKALEKFDIGMFFQKAPVVKSRFCNNIDALAAEVSSWKGFEDYATKLKTMKTDLMQNSYKAFDNEPGDVKVLVHGNFCKNNMMFKYDKSGVPDDAMILDFKFCCVAHPAIDLLFFLYTSTFGEVQPSFVFEMTQFYYYELKSVLIKMEYKLTRIPTLHQFQLQVLKKYFYAFTTAILFLPHMISNDSESAFEKVFLSDKNALAPECNQFKNEKLHEIIRKLLPSFDRLGLLDEM